jgi:putative ABC transport system permease protein
MNVLVRGDGDPRALIPAVRAALKDVDPQKPAQGLYALEDLFGATYARDRQTMSALVASAGIAVLLAVLGVYGVLSQRVRERAREIGIRMAMGADSGRLTRWVAGRGARLIAIGGALGIATAWLASGVLDGILFGVEATDGPTLVGVVVLLAVVGLAASIVPSWRATRIDPVRVLRQ